MLENNLNNPYQSPQEQTPSTPQYLLEPYQAFFLITTTFLITKSFFNLIEYFYKN